MKFPEPKTLRGATLPIILASWVFALGIIEYPIGHQRPVISLCWSIAHLFLFVSFATFSESRNLTQLHMSTLLVGTYRFYMLTSVVSVIVFVCLGRTTSKIVSASIHRLNIASEMMSKYEIPKEYGPTFKYQIIQLIGAFIFISVILTLNIFYIINDRCFRIAHLGYIGATHYIPTCSLIMECTFANFIRYIGKLFEHLNANLIRCSSQEKNTNSSPHGLESDGSLRPTRLLVNPHSVRLSDKQSMVHLICNSRKIHQELCSTARTLNEAFGVQILLSVTMSSVIITAVLYGMYDILVTSTSTSASTNITGIVIIVFWLIFFTAKVLYIVSICSMTSTQAQRMGELIHRLDKPTANIEVRKEIHAFSILLMQNPLRFTASGFFTLDFEMIRSLVGTVTTYLVIMIQLYNSDNPESELPNATPCAMNTTY